jgi:RNA polymerase sigma factor (sigma-70 family)
MTFRPRKVRTGLRGMLTRSRSSPNEFADFYAQTADNVIRFFASRTGDGQTALELTAETYSKAFEKRGDFRGASDEQAAAWLWSIVRNELARFRRTRSAELSALRRLGLERPTPNRDELRYVERLLASEEVRRHLTVALETLPREQQEVIRLRVIEELNDGEIAERLEVSREVVRARTSRALRALNAREQLRAAVKKLDA